MSALDEIRAERLKKLQILKDRGINPYPATTSRTHSIATMLESFESFVASGEEITLAGRVLITRGQGAIVFLDFDDGSGKFQAVFKEDVMESSLFTLFKEVVDSGDFIQITGTIFTTEKGQKSILAKKWGMLSKSLLPLPDKFHGLQNEEERFRKRYLDLLTHPELREMFLRKEKFWDVTRTFMKN